MEAFDSDGRTEIPGVSINRWEQAGIEMTEVIITDDDAAQQLGKPIGNYITMECAALKEQDDDTATAMSNILGEELARMLLINGIDLNQTEQAPLMIVGLGNRMVTPDSLGPSSIDRVLVTRHIFNELPYASNKMRSVCAIAPGVLGITGIETVEMVESLAAKLKPRAIIAIDSLAARSSDRIGCVLQITDSGIQPGSGVGNHRRPLTSESTGAPVLAVGMPTVIYASTLARDAIAFLADDTSDRHEATLESIESELASSQIGNMIVTPREVDSMIKCAASMISSGINRALQPDLSDRDIESMLK